MTKMVKQPDPTEEPGNRETNAVSPDGREENPEVPPNSAVVLEEVQALIEALREANGHLVAANFRSQALAERMNVLYEKAQSAVEAKDEFFALISHELRTPLTSIIGWAELLKLDPNRATIVEAARSIATSAAVQAQLIDDLLDVSRIMTNKFAITKAKFDLHEVVTDSISGMRPLADAKTISLRINAKESVTVDGDAARMRQVLSNLLGNAIKFTPAGGLIETCLMRDGSSAVIAVSDTGEGISPQFLPHIFERTAQAAERRFGASASGWPSSSTSLNFIEARSKQLVPVKEREPRSRSASLAHSDGYEPDDRSDPEWRAVRCGNPNILWENPPMESVTSYSAARGVVHVPELIRMELGKLLLYQLSYARLKRVTACFSDRYRLRFLSCAGRTSRGSPPHRSTLSASRSACARHSPASTLRIHTSASARGRTPLPSRPDRGSPASRLPRSSPH